MRLQHENCFRQISDKSNYCDIASFHIPRQCLLGERANKRILPIVNIKKAQRQW
jgi:hypothetical protein